MTKLSENFQYERLLEQAEVTNVSGFYRDYATACRLYRYIHRYTSLHHIRLTQCIFLLNWTLLWD